MSSRFHDRVEREECRSNDRPVALVICSTARALPFVLCPEETRLLNVTCFLSCSSSAVTRANLGLFSNVNPLDGIALEELMLLLLLLLPPPRSK